MKQFTIFELKTLEVYTLGMRVSPDITFDTANLVNKNYFSIKKAIASYNEKIELVQEREKEVGEDSKKIFEIAKNKEDLSKERFLTNIQMLDSKLFKDINGDCTLNLTTGSITLPYREIYFYLLEKEIIKE